MPSSLPAVRPALTALLTVLVVASSALVSAPATQLPAAQAVGAEAPASPSAPQRDTPLSMEIGRAHV